MDKNERYNARRYSERRNMITISIVAALFFICSIVIFATKYRNDDEWFAVAASEDNKNEDITSDNTDIAEVDDKNNENTENIVSGEADSEDTENVDSEESDTENTETTDSNEGDSKNIEEIDSEDGNTKNTEEVDSEDGDIRNTEETDSEEDKTESPSVDISEYVNVTDPDLSSKADDWYNDDLFIPGNVTDDSFFDSAVIIGDSRTEGLSLYTGMSNLDAFYSKGLNIEKVMTDEIVTTDDGTLVTVLDALKLKEYKSIYISFGINELGWIYDYLFIDAYKTFIDEVRAIEPEATIYIENILPVSAELSAEDDIYNNTNIENFNKLLKEMCEDYGDIIYLDVASSVSVDEVLPADASTDGRHCNKDYCEKWLNYIRENVYIEK